MKQKAGLINFIIAIIFAIFLIPTCLATDSFSFPLLISAVVVYLVFVYIIRVSAKKNNKETQPTDFNPYWSQQPTQASRLNNPNYPSAAHLHDDKQHSKTIDDNPHSFDNMQFDYTRLASRQGNPNDYNYTYNDSALLRDELEGLLDAGIISHSEYQERLGRN